MRTKFTKQLELLVLTILSTSLDVGLFFLLRAQIHSLHGDAAVSAVLAALIVIMLNMNRRYFNDG